MSCVVWHWPRHGRKAVVVVCIFVCAEISPALKMRLQKEGMSLKHIEVVAGSNNDITQTITLAQETSADWVVLDGYHFGSIYQKAIKQAGFSLICIDDYGQASHYYADLVLNQNISANASFYKDSEFYTRLLLGTRFALLRREYWPWRGWKRTISETVKKVLVTMGGSDSDNVTLKIINTLFDFGSPHFEIQIVVGPESQHLSTLQNALCRAPKSTRLLMNVTDMPGLMAWADVAISASGSTCWEMAFMGLPSVLFEIASNQDGNAVELGRIGAAIHVSDREQWDTALIAELKELDTNDGLRQKISNQAYELVDGYGLSRVISAIADMQG